MTTAALEAHLRLGGAVMVSYSHSQRDPLRMVCMIRVPGLGIEIAGPWSIPGESFVAALREFVARFPGDAAFLKLVENAAMHERRIVESSS